MIFNRIPRCVLLFVAASLLVVPVADAKVYKLYYLGGQSNMDGYGRVSELPEAMRGPVSGVMIFHGNTAPDGVAVDGRGKWSQLQPGHGVGFTSDGQKNGYSDRFGVELTLARRLKELHPDANIALWDYGDTVRAAQAAYAEKDGHAAIVTSTDDYGYSDKWHYDSPGYIDLGVNFADALAQLEKR